MKKDGVNKSHDNNSKLRKIVYYILGILEALLAFRLIFKLLGANHGSTFVSLIYNISGAFLSYFNFGDENCDITISKDYAITVN